MAETAVRVSDARAVGKLAVRAAVARAAMACEAEGRAECQGRGENTVEAHICVPSL